MVTNWLQPKEIVEEFNDIMDEYDVNVETMSDNSEDAVDDEENDDEENEDEENNYSDDSTDM